MTDDEHRVRKILGRRDPEPTETEARLLWITLGDDEWTPRSEEVERTRDRLSDALDFLDVNLVVSSNQLRPVDTPEMEEFADLVAEKVIEKQSDEPKTCTDDPCMRCP